MRRKRGAFHDLAGALDAREQCGDVRGIREEIGVDAGRIERVGRTQADAAAAARPQHRDMAGDAVAVMQAACVVVDEAGDEMQLDVRAREAGLGAQENPRLGIVRGQEPRAAIAPLEIARYGAQRRAERDAHQAAVGGAVHEREIDVVGEVCADAGQLVPHCDAVAREFLARPDAGQQQELRRTECAGRNDDLARGDARGSSRPRDIDARGTRAFECNGGGMTAGQHGQVGTFEHRVQERDHGAAAPPAALRHLVEARAVLLRAVEVGVSRKPRRDGRLDECPRRGRRACKVRNRQLSADSVPCIRPALLVLGALEHRQHRVEGPARIAERGPVVVIGAVPPHVDHRVDGARTAQHLPARLVTAAAAEARLRLGFEGPVDLAPRNGAQDAGRYVDERRAIGWPGLEQANAARGIVAQPVGQDASRRAGAHDHGIELHGPHFTV